MSKRRANSRCRRRITSSSSCSEPAAALLALRTSPPVFSAAQAERVARDTYGLIGSVRCAARRARLQLPPGYGGRAPIRAQDHRSRGGARGGRMPVASARASGRAGPLAPGSRVFSRRTLGEETGKVDRARTASSTPPVSSDSCRAGCSPKSPPERRLLENVGDTLARLDRALQGFFHPALGQRLAWDVRRLPELAEHVPTIESASVRRDVESTVAAFKERTSALFALRSQAIHGDCHGQNLLVDAADGSRQRHPGFRRHDPCAARFSSLR